MIYTTDQIERLFKELKRRLKVMEQLQREKGAEKIIYVILRELNERYMSRRLRGFERAIEDFLESRSAFIKSYQTQFT
ncbi:MAG: transposase [Thermotogaceae bacterium]|nr:transposase [Thermotogaceae bacterium]